MGMTRATFLISAALVVALVVAAAGMGAYLAVRQNATAPNAESAHPAPETRVAAVHGIDPQAAAGEPGSERGIAVESTEQTVEPVAAAGAEQPVAGTRQARQPQIEPPVREEPARRRSAARPPEPAPRPPAPSRREPSRPAPPATERIERSSPAPAPAAVEPESKPEPTQPTERPPARATAELPEIDGWRRAAPAPRTAAGNTAVRNEPGIPDLPPLASASFDPPNSRTGVGPPVATEEVVIPADSVIGLQIETFVTTDRAEVEDDVTARVTRDVLVARRVAIPAGSLVNGSVVMVERGGKLRGTSRLGVRFHTVVLDDGMEVPIVTETVYREGGSRGRDNAARIGGGAVAGAILGAIFGGGRGAAIGGAAGAAGGTAAAAAGDAEPATLPMGTTLTVRLSRPASVSLYR